MSIEASSRRQAAQINICRSFSHEIAFRLSTCTFSACQSLLKLSFVVIKTVALASTNDYQQPVFTNHAFFIVECEV